MLNRNGSIWTPKDMFENFPSSTIYDLKQIQMSNNNKMDKWCNYVKHHSRENEGIAAV